MQTRKQSKLVLLFSFTEFLITFFQNTFSFMIINQIHVYDFFIFE
jgi:hypothetical protein